MTLIEVLVAIGLLSVISMVLGNIILNQSTQMRRLYQKSDALEFKNSLQQVLNDPAKCSWQLMNKVLDVSAATPTHPSPTVLNFPILYEGPNTTSSILAQKDNPLFNNSLGIIVGDIVAKKFIPTGTPDEYHGIVEVQLKEKDGTYTMKPVQGIVYVRTESTDPLNGKRIVSCKSVAADPKSSILDADSFAMNQIHPPGMGIRQKILTTRTVEVPDGTKEVIVQVVVQTECIGS